MRNRTSVVRKRGREGEREIKRERERGKREKENGSARLLYVKRWKGEVARGEGVPNRSRYS
jgi:hypothetical protein